MKMRYNYRLKPTKVQVQLMKQIIGQQRFVWNYFLAKEIDQYNADKTFNFYHKNSASLPNLKKEFAWLTVGLSQSLQQTLKDLNNALTVSFKNKDRGFPRFKKRKEFDGSFRIVQTPDKWTHTKSTITLPKLGKIRWVKHRALPSKFSTATITIDGNKWFISIVVDREEATPVQISHINEVVGIDLNSSSLVVTSHGEFHENPKFFKKSKSKLKKKQRQFAKKTKGSNRRKLKQLQVRKAYKKITNQRKDFLHKISSLITNDYNLLCLEDLNVKGMQKFNGAMVNDAGWSMLTAFLSYKAKLKGKTIVKIGRFAPSSKACNNCGHIHQNLTLSDRTYDCSYCGHTQDRDINAALNIRDWGIEKYTDGTSGICGGQQPEANGRGDINVRPESHDSCRYVSLNRQKFLFNQEARCSLDV